MSEVLSDCFNKYLRDFLVSVTIHKARNLNALNADTLVIVNFNDATKKTKTYQNSDCPFFNEYFVFEQRTTLDELLKKNIRLTVIQENCFLKKNAVIGEANVNLRTVWNQNYHAFLKKWATLEKIGDDKKNLTTGYLQIDLTIVTTNEPPAPALLQSFDDDVIADNLLLPDETSSERERVKYLVNIFEGNFVLKRDYILQVSFGSFRTRTRQLKYTKYCKWNEQFIFRGLFLSLNQTMVFEVLVQEHCQWKIKCSTEVHFNNMSWKVDTNYNKPFFGPSYIYLYEGTHKNIYFGKLLISIETEDVDEHVVETLTNKQDILMPLNETDYWNEEIFKVNMVLVSMDALSFQQNRMKIYLSCENVFSNTIDLDVQKYSVAKMKLKFVYFESNCRPILSLNIKLPDNRLKFQLMNLVKMLVIEMEENIENFKLFEARYHDNMDYKSQCLTMFLNDFKDMLNGLRNKLFHRTFKKITEWDENFVKYLRFTIETCIEKVDEAFRDFTRESNFKRLLKEYLSLHEALMETLNDMIESLPDLFLNIACDGKLFSFHRFKLVNYFHSQAFDARGNNCGKIQQILLKPSTCMHTCQDCGCLFGKSDIFLWIGSVKEDSEWLPQNTAELTTNKINFNVERFYKCNVFVHQAKIQPGFNLVESKLVIVANGMHEKTKVVPQVVTQSLSAVWNEVLVIENIKVFDIGKQADYPSIIMFLFDEDKRKMNLIGTGSMKIAQKSMEKKPIKQKLLPDKFDIRRVFHQFVNQFPPHLRWINFYKEGSLAAEVLMSAEFIQLQVPSLTLREVEKNDPIPAEIRPEMKKFRMEATFVGIREATNLSQFACGRFRIELSMGELKLTSGFSGKAYKTNMNFLDPHSSGYLMLPEQIHYWPPILIKHLDCSRKRPTVIGSAMIRRPEKLYEEKKPKEMQRFLLNKNSSLDVEAQEFVEKFELEESEPLLATSSKAKMKLRTIFDKFPKLPKFFQPSQSFHQLNPLTLENEFTWWTKFYNSNRKMEFRNDCLQYLTIFPSELEKQSKFEYFNDWAVPVDLVRGVNESKSNSYAKLKCSIRISKCFGKEFFESGKEEKFSVNFPRFKQNLMVEFPVVIRVYIVEALNLRSRDFYGNSDAFVKVELGSQTISDRSHFVPNQFSPVFGKRFQLNGVIPQNNLLKISAYDRDSFSWNDLIGSTTIDIEDRVKTKYFAGCGLPNEFNADGYNVWRNSILPSEILDNFCNEMKLSKPQYFLDYVEIAGIQFMDSSRITKDQRKKERLALSALKRFNEIPGIGFSFVPEHVETRSLYHEDRPGVEQGKLLMWVEIFDSRKTIPEPIDITPVPPRPYELRVIIWNARDVILDERNIFGKKMSDIYVKGWLHNNEDVQYTDIHYRSLNGEGNFNWRMIFLLKYSVGEDMMVVTKKRSNLEKLETEMKQPAVLNLQIWDNDSFSPDDFLGTLCINLSHFERPFMTPDRCSIKKLKRPHENLFAMNGSLRGWFPAYGKSSNSEAIRQTGKLELELEVIPEEKAKTSPVGVGREGPNRLPNPNRPETSFNWLSNPMKSMKLILWPQVKKTIIIVILILLFILFIGLMIINFPQKIVAKAVGDSTYCIRR